MHGYSTEITCSVSYSIVHEIGVKPENGEKGITENVTTHGKSHLFTLISGLKYRSRVIVLPTLEQTYTFRNTSLRAKHCLSVIFRPKAISQCRT